MNESNKVSRAVYVVPVIYVLGMYMMPVLFWIICNMQESTESFDAGWIMVMPIVLGLINLAVVLILGKRISTTASHLHKDYKICVNTVLCSRWVLHHSGTSFNVYTGCYHDICRTDCCNCAISYWLAGAVRCSTFCNCLYCKGMQRGSTRKGAVCICRHIPVLFHVGCDFCDRTGGEG